eukprot:m.65195 g.65195  ORF g.65195 m.65195 type:complete len:238 (-) comp11717_c0_seq2:1619-2332(-)
MFVFFAKILLIVLVLQQIGTGIAVSVTLTHYSDAQCPCSARVPQDMFTHFLDSSTSKFPEGVIQFKQYFVGDLLKNVSKCIHGEEECVAQRHFACAQNLSQSHLQWLSFEECSYGHCKDCAAIDGPHCPCYNYTIFPEYNKNSIMETCAKSTGFDWTELHQCGTSSKGQRLMELSSAHSNADGITYGVDGLAPIYLDGQKIKTKEPIPVVCGPTPTEVHNAVCARLKALGATPAACT